jgi:hypothetical protein
LCPVLQLGPERRFPQALDDRAFDFDAGHVGATFGAGLERTHDRR